MVRKLKHTEIGDIPVDWELQTFDETFRVISNNTLSRENLNNRGGAVRNIHYGDILTKFPEVLDCSEDEIPFVNDLSLLSSSTQLLQDGDIVVADTAEDETVGKVIEVQNLGDSKLVAGLHTIPCRVKKGDFAPGWLGYYMNSDLFHNQILPYITGIKVSSISKGAISETLILVPPFDEQEKIVQSLNKIQLLMTAETKVVNKIKLVKNGCLSKMFPQKDDTVPEIRLPGFTEAWEQRKLSEIATMHARIGWQNLRTSEFLDSGDYMLITGTDFIDGAVNFDTCHYVERERYEQDKHIQIRNGSILITKDGTLGKVAYIQGLTMPATLNAGVFNVEIKDENEVDNRYLFQYLKAPFLMDYVDKKATGGTIKHLNQNILVDFPVVLPHKAEQEKIGEYFLAIDHLITLHRRAL